MRQRGLLDGGKEEFDKWPMAGARAHIEVRSITHCDKHQTHSRAPTIDHAD